MLAEYGMMFTLSLKHKHSCQPLHIGDKKKKKIGNRVDCQCSEKKIQNT